MIGGTDKLDSFIFVGIRHRQQNAPKSGPPHLIFRREIRAAKKWFSIGQQESRQWPATLPGNCADGGLIPRIDVRPLVAVDFHGHKILVDNFRDLGVLVTLAIDHMAPVTPHGADIEKNGLIFRFRARKSRIAPFVPVDGLVRCGTQIGTGRILQAVFGMLFSRRSTRNPFGWRSAGSMPIIAAAQRESGKETLDETQTTARCLRGRDRAGRAACARQILRLAGDKNECGLRPASSRDKRLRCRSRRENRASLHRGP